jgi:hypothetical protein
VTVTLEPPPLDALDAGVIEDARARQRRHRRGCAAAVVVAVLVAGLVAHEAGGGAPRKPRPGSSGSSALTPVGHDVSFRSRRGQAEASFAVREPSGVILVAQISAPPGVRAYVDATNPWGGSAHMTTMAGRHDPSLSCHLRGGVDVCTQAYEACPMSEATWRVHVVKLSGPAGMVRVNFVVGAPPSQT